MHRKLDLISVLWRIILLTAVVAASAHFVAYLYVALTRMSFQFTLEWLEGDSLIQVMRILDGRPLYDRPSFEYVPLIYPPLYFYLSALASRLLGDGFLPLRLVSFLSSIGVMVLIAGMVRQQSGRILGGLLAAGLFCATYALTGHWFDLARIDTLALALLLLSAYLLLKDTLFSSVLGGAFLALSCLTKQNMFPCACILAVYSILPPRRNSLIFLASALLLFGCTILVLNRIYHGWFFYYVFTLPARHILSRDIISLGTITFDFVVERLIKPIPFAILFALMYWFIFPARSPISHPESNSVNVLGKGPWPRRFIWLLLIVMIVTASASVWYLVRLPSSNAGPILGSFSYARLGLIASQVVFGLACLVCGVKMLRDYSFGNKIISLIYGDVRTVPRFILICVVLVCLSIAVLAPIWPRVSALVNSEHLERLTPYLVELAILLLVLLISWRLIWGVTRLNTWFYIFFSGGLIVISFLGRVNIGGYLNALMPAYAGISILFGLAVSSALNGFASHPSLGTKAIRFLAPFLTIAQFVLLISPLASQIPSDADADAGLELVNRIRTCSTNVYFPYQPYLSMLAGKPPYAGWIEMADLNGHFTGEPDVLWPEVEAQIQSAFESREIGVVVQDNYVTEPSLSGGYLLSGRIFEDEHLFWPVTGGQNRPEGIYEMPGLQGCDLEIR